MDILQQLVDQLEIELSKESTKFELEKLDDTTYKINYEDNSYVILYITITKSNIDITLEKHINNRIYKRWYATDIPFINSEIKNHIYSVCRIVIRGLY